MKVDMIKQPGGLLNPASDMEAERLKKFKNGEHYQIDMKMTRNPKFHGKMFVFFEFCFQYWKSDREFQDEVKQFDAFRKDLTCLAGFYDSFYNIKGEVRIEARSLSYGSMDPEEFEQCYKAMIQASMTHIFQAADENTYNRLMSFF